MCFFLFKKFIFSVADENRLLFKYYFSVRYVTKYFCYNYIFKSVLLLCSTATTTKAWRITILEKCLLAAALGFGYPWYRGVFRGAAKGTLNPPPPPRIFLSSAYFLGWVGGGKGLKRGEIKKEGKFGQISE